MSDNIRLEGYRIVAGAGRYSGTFAVVEWLPVFVDQTACEILTESLDCCTKSKSLGVNACVIIPTHLHAILFDVDFNTD